MKISEKWLRSFVEINKSIEEIAAILTLRGLEFESITPVAAKLDNVVVAEIIKAEKHPNADRLRVCQVNDGNEIVTIVCGAPNARDGIKVALAKIGAVLPQVTIKKSKIRDVESHGMLCSVTELGLAETSEGIMELPVDAPVGKSITDYLELDDTILDISITPNRGDCTSVLGIAREVAAIDGAKIPPSSLLKKGEQRASLAGRGVGIHISNQAIDICPIYLTEKITNINPKIETPIWMKERLRRSGIRSINVPVDVTNYVMLECGQPLHAFDAQKISGNIDVRFAKMDETLELLHDTKITLDEKSLIIADAEGPIALAGIMGGKRTAVSETTTDIILECAHFSPENIARTARKFNISSDSAYRFERGVDPQLPQSALARAKNLIAAIVNKESRASSSDGVTERSEHHIRPKINLRYHKIEKVLGVKIPETEIKKYFTALNLTFEETTEGLSVTPPSYRFDLNIEEDLIEEVLRMHGCDAITEIAPPSNLSLQANLISTNVDAERLILKARGYNEIISYSFVDEKLQTQLFPSVKALKLVNPISQEMNVMRTSLWVGLLSTLIYNLNQGQTRARLFEVGLCFAENNLQQKKIAGLCYGSIYPEAPGNNKDDAHFFDVKKDVEMILAGRNLSSEYLCLPTEYSTYNPLHPRQSTKFVHKTRETEVAVIGVLHPRLVEALGLSVAPVLFEIDVDELFKPAPKKQYVQLSKFPSSRRDLSFIMPIDVTYQAMQGAILGIDSDNRIRMVEVFDVYRGKGIPEEQKSIGIRLTLQDFYKTLTNDEIANLIQKVIDLMRKQFGATLRD